LDRAGKIDFSLGYSSYFVAAIDVGEPVVLLAGVHSAASNCSRRKAFAASPTSRALPTAPIGASSTSSDAS
jgi:hypothetical protein